MYMIHVVGTLADHSVTSQMDYLYFVCCVLCVVYYDHGYTNEHTLQINMIYMYQVCKLHIREILPLHARCIHFSEP